ncbi:MAG TPA: methionyl-tRNA formyltransferase [Anaerolineales bacterium]|nr:methionyl-tRNA formyltransferase [Anaerolineales bacterium]
MPARLVFMGSPDFALPTLRALAANYDVVGVITQPDRPAGRGKQLTAPPVKILAKELDLPVIQPARLREPPAMAQLRAWAPDLIVVAAFGQILRQEVLDLPLHGCLNVHASLLPRWRGASPIQAAILAGDAETGVTIMRMDKGLDTGPILIERAIPIAPDDTAATLSDKLSTLGADILIETLPKYLSSELKPTPQPEAGATSAPILKKSDGELDAALSAEELARKVRAFNPWPGAFIVWKRQPLKVHRARIAAGNAASGQRRIEGGLPAIGTADGLLILNKVQPAGKKPMSGEEFLRGAHDWIN